MAGTLSRVKPLGMTQIQKEGRAAVDAEKSGWVTGVDVVFEDRLHRQGYKERDELSFV